MLCALVCGVCGLLFDVVWFVVVWFVVFVIHCAVLSGLFVCVCSCVVYVCCVWFVV